jgi:glycosyltransferase involved in cell wall biosynthesis
VKVISYSQNSGKGHAIKTGFMEAKGEIVIFIDSDLEIDLKTISRYVEALKNADIVIATKWHPESEVSMSLGRKLMSRTYNVLARLLIGFDSVNAIFSRLAVKRYAFDVELLAVSHLYGLKIVEMPVRLDLDAPFKVKEAWRMFVDLLGIAYRLRVTRWYQKQTTPKTSF